MHVRIYTAFVSSTYLDLVTERKRVAEELESRRCLPLAMEAFPSTGDTQWAFIEESIDLADFCVFIVAGRYGSIDPETGISWTHREWREAVAKNKRCVVLVHRNWRDLPSAQNETDPDRIAGLEAFHDELAQAGQNNVLFSTTDELVGGLHRSVSRLIESEAVEGWMRASESLNIQVVYDLVDVRARFRPSTTVPETLDLDYRARRVFRGRQLGGLTRLAISWPRPNDDFLPFGPHNNAVVELVDADRSGGGDMSLTRRKDSGSSFVFDLVFDPPLRFDEVADITVTARIDGYEYLYAEDRREATRNSVEGVSEFGEWNWVPATRPLRELEMSVEVAQTAVRKIRGLTVEPTLRQWSAPERAAAMKATTYTHEVTEIDGEPYDRMHVSAINPILRTTYALSWYLPKRGAGR